MKTKKQLARCPGMARGLKRRLNKMIKHHMLLMVFHSRDALLQLPSVTLVMYSDKDADYISGKFWFQYADERYKVFLNIIKHDHFTACNDTLPLLFVHTNCSQKHLLFSDTPYSWDEVFNTYVHRFKTGHTRHIQHFFKVQAQLCKNSYTQNLLPLLNKAGDEETEATLQCMQQLLKEALNVLQRVLFHSYDELFTENNDVVLDFAFRYGCFAQHFFGTEGQMLHCKRLQRILEGCSYHYPGYTYEGENSMEKRRESLKLFLSMMHTGIPELYVQKLKKVQQRRHKAAMRVITTKPVL